MIHREAILESVVAIDIDIQDDRHMENKAQGIFCHDSR